MTPHPKRRWSTRRQGKHRADQKITLPSLVECSNCHKPTPSHAACRYCKFYKGVSVSK